MIGSHWSETACSVAYRSPSSFGYAAALEMPRTAVSSHGTEQVALTSGSDEWRAHSSNGGGRPRPVPPGRPSYEAEHRIRSIGLSRSPRPKADLLHAFAA